MHQTIGRMRYHDEASRRSDLVSPVPCLLARLKLYITTKRGLWPSVERISKWIIACGFDHPVLRYNLAKNLQERGKLREACKHYKRAIELRQDYYSAYNNLGTVLTELGEYELAEKAFLSAIEIRDYAYPHCNLGDVYIRQKRYEEALKELDIAVEMLPDFAEAHFNRAIALWNIWKLKEAELSFLRALSLNDWDAEFHLEFGKFLIELGRYDEGVMHMRNARSIERENTSKVNASEKLLKEWRKNAKSYNNHKRRLA